jgi:creatinine amidohydrolase/Fe(II)-dependent formamide hydrolase-like protein
MFPIIPLGTGGANEISGKYSWPGTYAVRAETLRAIFMDLATELGEQGFRWIFVVHNHGSPWHNKALDQAGDFFRDTYGGRMVNLTGLEPDWAQVAAARKGLVKPEADAEDARSVHAGLSETSRVMYVRPDLVSAEKVRATTSVTTPLPRLVEVARKPDWPGYFGAPRFASAELGRAEHEAAASAWIALATRILNGEDERKMQRYADMMLGIPMIQAMGTGSAQYEATVARKQSEWIARQK